MLCRSASAWTRQPQWMLSTETALWLATPAGLFQYDADGEIFLPEAFPDMPTISPFEMAWDGEQLWLIADSAASYIDLRTGGRYSFAASDGLPPGRLSCLAFAQDYVWVGSDRGVARFDRLIEQWEYFSLKQPDWPEGTGRVYRIHAEEDYIYFATDGGILRFDPKTETFIRYGPADGLRGDQYRDLQRIGEELWCFGEEGIDIYSVRQRSWTFLGRDQGFRRTDWRDIEAIGGNLYFLHSGGIDVCDPAAHRIYPFDREERLKGYDVQDLAGFSSELWFATDRGLLRYQAENPQTGRAETWVLFDPSRGASQAGFYRVAVAGNTIFGFGTHGLDVLDRSTEIFLAPLIFPEKVPESKKAFRGPRISWDERGLRFQPAPSAELGLQGHYSYLVQTNGDQSADPKGRAYASRHWGRLQPYFNHATGRTVNGLYDNTDPDETLYGATYRGLDGDLLRRAQAGNRVPFSQTFDSFFGRTTLRGASAMLEAGPRRGARKRSLFRSNWTAGERVTRSIREFFTGAQGPVYLLQHQDLLIGGAQVWLNGQILSPGDYTLNHALGRLFFTFPGWELLNEGDIIEVQYQYRLNEDEISEMLSAGEVIVSRGDAFQIAVSGFDKSESTLSSEDTSQTESDAFQAAQVAAEVRGQILGGEGVISGGVGAGGKLSEDQSAHAGFVEGSLNRGAWTVSGKWLALTDSLTTLEDRSTEFGYLKGEDALEVRFEPSGKFWMEAKTGERRGKEGSERNYHVGGLLSPAPGTSTFGNFQFFDASSDSLKRERWIAFGGIETAFFPWLLQTLKLRSSRLQVLGRVSEVRLDSLAEADSSRTDLCNRSLLTRWAIVPGPKVSFYPEVRWAYSERSTAGGPYRPEREELAPRASLYSHNLIPGAITYFNAEATYTQADFELYEEARNLRFERQGIAQISLSPGVYFPTLNPVSLRLDLARNASDSLIGIGEDTGLFDLGFSWRDYDANVSSQRFDSDAIQVTWAPNSVWLLYQSASSVRSTGLPEEQFFSTRLEWNPNSRDQVFWKYMLNRTLAVPDDKWRHRPGLEWYRRWSPRTYTRGQFYATLQDEPDHRSLELSPGGYLDQKFGFPWGLGKGTFRTDLSVTYFHQTRPAAEETLSLGGYGRLDWEMGRWLLLRIRLDGDYQYSYITSADDLTWSLEVRLSARF